MDQEAKIVNYEAMIKAAIENCPIWKKCSTFYIGKTDDFARRHQEHKGEGYNYGWELAKGTSKQISLLENSLIQYYKRDKRLGNTNAGSAGNEEANILYIVCYCKPETLLVDEVADDEFPIEDGFPLDLQKQYMFNS